MPPFRNDKLLRNVAGAPGGLTRHQFAVWHSRGVPAGTARAREDAQHAGMSNLSVLALAGFYLPWCWILVRCLARVVRAALRPRPGSIARAPRQPLKQPFPVCQAARRRRRAVGAAAGRQSAGRNRLKQAARAMAATA